MSAAAAAVARLADVRAELAASGGRAALAERLAGLEQTLPAEVELGPDTAPSVAMRLRRAGLRVR